MSREKDDSEYDSDEKILKLKIIMKLSSLEEQYYHY